MKFQNCINPEDANIEFEDVLFTGFMGDGGLVMPANPPKFTAELLNSWQQMTYPELMTEVMLLFLGEDASDMKEEIIRSYESFQEFQDVAPLTPITTDAPVYLLSLFQGPTLSFKDYAMVCVAAFLKRYLPKRQRQTIALVATSGDTGSAAIRAAENLPGLHMFVMYPLARVSHIQELQLTASSADNIHVLSAPCTSDDFDAIIRRLSMDEEFSRSHHLMSFNSLHVVRILAQTVHFLYAYLKMRTKYGADSLKSLRIVVPSGGLGNMAAGCLAREMGLPVELVLACNQNDVCHLMIQTAVLHKVTEVKKSASCAMDIAAPCNVPRLLWLFSGGDAQCVKSLMDSMESTGSVKLPQHIYEKMRSVIVDSISVSEEETMSVMRRTWQEHQIRLCPHTACAAAYVFRRGDMSKEPPTVLIGTAHPMKFPESLAAAGVPLEEVASLKALEERNVRHVREVEDPNQVERVLRDWIADCDPVPGHLGTKISV